MNPYTAIANPVRRIIVTDDVGATLKSLGVSGSARLLGMVLKSGASAVKIVLSLDGIVLGTYEGVIDETWTLWFNTTNTVLETIGKAQLPLAFPISWANVEDGTNDGITYTTTFADITDGRVELFFDDPEAGSHD